MSEMIERVAKAIYHGTPRNKPYELLHPTHARYWEKRAIAAIEAMRNPGMDALDAMNDIAIDGPGYVSFSPSLHDCAVLFNAGIDAALSSAPAGGE